VLVGRELLPHRAVFGFLAGALLGAHALPASGFRGEARLFRFRLGFIDRLAETAQLVRQVCVAAGEWVAKICKA
jgi:hypothetical protein